LVAAVSADRISKRKARIETATNVTFGELTNAVEHDPSVKEESLDTSTRSFADVLDALEPVRPFDDSTNLAAGNPSDLAISGLEAAVSTDKRAAGDTSSAGHAGLLDKQSNNGTEVSDAAALTKGWSQPKVNASVTDQMVRTVSTAKGSVLRAGRQRRKGRQAKRGNPHLEGRWIIVNRTQAMPSPQQQEQVLIAEQELSKPTGTAMELVEAVAGGTGAAIGGTGNPMLDKNLARRMRLQDEVVMLLMLLLYFTSLAFSAGMVYRQAANNSPVSFYADPRQYSATAHGTDVEDFLEAFNQSPKGVYLRVTGFTPATEHSLGAVRWKGEFLIVDFTFSLDLSTWVVRGSGSGTAEDGMPQEDVDLLRRWLRDDKNDLATVQVRRSISWSNWEELATNMKHIIRQRGFDGLIDIECAREETVTIYKNTQWANFMHRSTLKVIMVLSVIGWALYVPYMWLRCTRLVLRSSHRVTIDIGDYWRLISDSLGAHGFDGPQEWMPDLSQFSGQALQQIAQRQQSRQNNAPFVATWDPISESEADGDGPSGDTRVPRSAG